MRLAFALLLSLPILSQALPVSSSFESQVGRDATLEASTSQSKAHPNLLELAHKYYRGPRYYEKEKKRAIMTDLLANEPLSVLDVNKLDPKEFVKTFYALRPSDASIHDKANLGRFMHDILLHQTLPDGYWEAVREAKVGYWKELNDTEERKARNRESALRSHYRRKERERAVRDGEGPAVGNKRKETSRRSGSEQKGKRKKVVPAYYDRMVVNEIADLPEGMQTETGRNELLDVMNKYYSKGFKSRKKKIALMKELYAEGGILYGLDSPEMTGEAFAQKIFEMMPYYRTRKENQNLGSFFIDCLENRPNTDSNFKKAARKFQVKIRKRAQYQRDREKKGLNSISGEDLDREQDSSTPSAVAQSPRGRVAGEHDRAGTSDPPSSSYTPEFLLVDPDFSIDDVPWWDGD